MTSTDTEAPIRIVIADDHLLYRTGVKMTLSIRDDVKVIAEADDGMHLLNVLKMTEVDVILLDIQMPIMDGVGALTEIKKNWPNVKIIILTMINDQGMMTKLMELGANCYLSKTSDSEVIYEAIKTCHKEKYNFT